MERSATEGPSGLARVDLMLRGDCNIRCPFCYQGIFEGHDRFDFSLQRMQQTMDQGRRHGYEELYISGGEPTISEELLAVVQYARSRGYQKIKVMTNGVRLADPAFSAELCRAGLTGVAFSLHGHDAAVHLRHTARPGSFEALITGLQLMQEQPAVDVEVNTVVTRHNSLTLEPLARLVASLGVAELHLQHVVPGSPGARAMTPDATGLQAALRQLIQRCPPRLHLSLAFIPYCWMRGLEHYIPRFDFTTRFLSNCPTMFEGWRDALLAAKVVTDECHDCADFDWCRGHWVGSLADS